LLIGHVLVPLLLLRSAGSRQEWRETGKAAFAPDKGQAPDGAPVQSTTAINTIARTTASKGPQQDSAQAVQPRPIGIPVNIVLTMARPTTSRARRYQWDHKEGKVPPIKSVGAEGPSSTHRLAIDVPPGATTRQLIVRLRDRGGSRL
jgi:hypothetical protein